MDDKKQHQQTSESQIRILIVDGNRAVRQGLAQLINRECHLGLCAEADNANQALNAIEEHHLDFAIVDVSRGSETSVQLAEKIKLQCPNLPVLILSIDNEVFYCKHPLWEQTPNNAIDQQSAEKIVKAIRYIQSLLKSRVFGFTVLVKVEKAGKS
ncbi:MAG: response regulator [Planctomycetota bacterium]|nr:MAG: response regulator [Planctomycetota bacterium]